MRGEHTIHPEAFNPRAGTNDVRNRVLRSDLVKSHVGRRHTMNAPLGFCNSTKNGERARFNSWSKSRGFQQRADLSVAAAMRVRVFAVRVFAVRVFAVCVFAVCVLTMRVFAVRVFAVRVFAVRVFAVRVFAVRVLTMRVFAIGMGMHIKFPARDPLPEAPLKVRVDCPGHAEGFQGIEEYGLWNTQIPEGSNGHISGDAGKAVEIKNSHGNFQ